MGRKRKWSSDAERMAAKRSGIGPLPAEDYHRIEREVETTLEESFDSPRAAPISEDAYVWRELEITRAQILTGLMDHDGKRLERCERYARRRYRAFLSGEVASL